MKRKSITLSAIFILSSIIWYGCSNLDNPQPTAQELRLPSTPFNYEDVNFPENFHLEYTDNTPENNQISNAGATLGRVLFYDNKLSLNNAKNCASCHKQHNAFSDVVAHSNGFKGELTKRNSMPIFNTRFMSNFFWDSRIDNMEDQVVMPIADHIEMGLQDEEFIIQKLSASEHYPQLFEEAFGTETISMDRVKKALAQFVRSIGSYQSKFDAGVEQDFANFNYKEIQGMAIFSNAQCNNCHHIEGLHNVFKVFPDLMDQRQSNGGFVLEDFELISQSNSDFDFSIFTGGINANIGLEEDYTDKGLYYTTGNSADEGKFKIPNLRNIALTAPYMHDGRFATLEDVLEHYNTGIINHENLDFRLRSGVGNFYGGSTNSGNGEPVNFDFDKDEIEALLAFFNTLTDTKLLNDEKFSNPFK